MSSATSPWPSGAGVRVRDLCHPAYGKRVAGLPPRARPKLPDQRTAAGGLRQDAGEDSRPKRSPTTPAEPEQPSPLAAHVDRAGRPAPNFVLAFVLMACVYMVHNEVDEYFSARRSPTTSLMPSPIARTASNPATPSSASTTSRTQPGRRGQPRLLNLNRTVHSRMCTTAALPNTTSSSPPRRPPPRLLHRQPGLVPKMQPRR